MLNNDPLLLLQNFYECVCSVHVLATGVLCFTLENGVHVLATGPSLNCLLLGRNETSPQINADCIPAESLWGFDLSFGSFKFL